MLKWNLPSVCHLLLKLPGESLSAGGQTLPWSRAVCVFCFSAFIFRSIKCQKIVWEKNYCHHFLKVPILIILFVRPTVQKPQIYSVYHHKQTKTNTNWEATVTVTSTWCHKYSVEQQYKYFYLAWLLETRRRIFVDSNKEQDLPLCTWCLITWAQICGRLHSRILRGDLRRGGKTDDHQVRRWEQVLKKAARETQHVVKVMEEHMAWPRGQRGPHLQLLDRFFWVLFKASLLDVEVGRSE